MCTVCGCGQATVEPRQETPAHPQGQGHDHDHDHGHRHRHAHRHARTGDRGSGLAGVSVPGMAPERMVRVERDILAHNAALAADNRAWYAARRILALNLVSSPGSGKTALLTRSIGDLRGKAPIAVIEGDQQTSVDAERIRETGVPALQINTGKGCHLDAAMVGRANAELDPPAGALVFIENVGNLVCPAAFDLGEAHKVVILSVTEGEDKPLKYPDMFHAADLMLLNKIDLLPHLAFDVERCVEMARRVNPRLRVLMVSATRGDGLEAWYDWVLDHRPTATAA